MQLGERDTEGAKVLNESRQLAELAELGRKVEGLYSEPRDIILNQSFEQAMFQRPALTGVPSYDLANLPGNPNQIQRAGGIPR